MQLPTRPYLCSTHDRKHDNHPQRLAERNGRASRHAPGLARTAVRGDAERRSLDPRVWRALAVFSAACIDGADLFRAGGRNAAWTLDLRAGLEPEVCGRDDARP